MTSRLTLRRFAWDAVCAIVEGRRLASWAVDYPTEGDTVIAGILRRAGQAAARSPEVPWGHWQLVERSSGLVIGGIGFLTPPTAGTVEIGYGVVPSRQRRGYATEAVRTMVRLASADGTVATVVASTDRDNVASQRVLEKSGFQCVERGDDVRYERMLPR